MQKMAGSNYALFEVQPLLNCLKVMLRACLYVGDEVTLDEGGISLRSRYGQDLIFSIQQSQVGNITSKCTCYAVLVLP